MGLCLVHWILYSRQKGLGSRPGWMIVLFSWEKHLSFTLPFSAQELKWVLAKFQVKPDEMLGVLLTVIQTDIPFRGKGGCIILLDTSCYGRWGKQLLDGSLKYILNPFLPTCTPDNLQSVKEGTQWYSFDLNSNLQLKP